MDEPKAVDLKGLIRRRKKSFVLCFLSVFFMAVLIAFVLPPIYLSQSTILIEDQQIPREYVQTTITGFVEERLQVITQQIMSRSRLMEMINRFNLYQEMRDRYTTEEIIEKMRDDIHLETISAEVMDRRTGRPTAATIAFTLSYEGKNPSTVQKVSNVLASFYLEQNLKSREQRASNTTIFLQQESDALKGQIDAIENKISEFKKAHIGELPEYNALNLQAITQLNRDVDHIEMQISSLKERKILLEGQIANVDPLSPIVTEEGKAIMHPGERLKYLRLQLISLQSALSEKHPDMKKLKKEIHELQQQVEESDASIEKVKRLNALTGQLAAMKGKLGPKHPDVVRLSKEVEVLGKEVENIRAEKVSQDLIEQKPDNPAYINLKTQIDSVEIQSTGLLEEKQQIENEIAKYQRKIGNVPVVEKEFNKLIRDYENAKYKYNEIMAKLMEAKVAQGMEETQRGERFTIIDPGQLPEKPYKPNRLAILLIGFVLALGAGVGVSAVRENLDTSIKTAEELGQLTNVPVLSVISMMQSYEDVRARRIKWAVIILAAIGILVATLLIVHHFIMPLEIVWVKIQRRMMTMTTL